MPSKIAGYVVDLMIAKFHEDGLIIKKHIKPSPEKNLAEIVWEEGVIHLYPHPATYPPGRSMLHELVHQTFDAGEEVHEAAVKLSTVDPIYELERLIWRGLDATHRDALNALAEEE